MFPFPRSHFSQCFSTSYVCLLPTCPCSFQLFCICHLCLFQVVFICYHVLSQTYIVQCICFAIVIFAFLKLAFFNSIFLQLSCLPFSNLHFSFAFFLQLSFLPFSNLHFSFAFFLHLSFLPFSELHFSIPFFCIVSAFFQVEHILEQAQFDSTILVA